MTKSKENICKQCSKAFKSEKMLQRHERTHTNANQCKMCQDLTFNTIEEYKLHVTNIHSGQSSYYFMCSECARQFKTKGELKIHIASKCGTIRLFKCKVCDKELMSAGSLHNHMLRHKGSPSHMCRFCAKLFLTSGQLKVHERKHTQEKPFICEVCGKGFCHRQSLITHSTLHTGIKPFTCENCGDSFSCVGNLLKHRTTHAECSQIPLTTHSVQNPATKMKIRVNTPACVKLKSLQKEKELQEKLEKLQKENQEKCEETEEINNVEIREYFDSQLNDENSEDIGNEINVSEEGKSAVISNQILNNLMEDCLDGTYLNNDSESQSNDSNNCEEIGDSISEDDVEQANHTSESQRKTNIAHKTEIQCKYCKKSYSNPVWLIKHEKQHSSEITGKFKCTCCKLDFKTKDECLEHQRKEHTSLLTCFECDKIYSNQTSLKAHEKYFHAGITKKSYTYICENCGKQFPQKSLLLTHKEHNCGEVPKLQCEICDRKFATNWSRNSHMKVHEDKKLLCKFCGKKFHRKGQLKVHERSHTGEKPYTCLYCPKAFAYRDSLITHSSLHTGIKPHLCEACGSRFSCLGNLLKHRSTHASTCGVWYSKNKEANS